MDFPKLRNVNIFPVQMSGQTLVCLQDPQNVSESALFLTPPVHFIVSLLDGQHSILDIQTAYMRRFGEILYSEKIQEVVEQLEESVSSLGRRVCYIASADLAHMGLQFGDPEGIGEYDLRILAEEDQAMLGYVERFDGEGFFSSISKERDRRRICGLPAVYTLLKTVEAKEGRLLKYGQAFTPDTQSVVTFSSLAFY